jgi:Matrixin
MPFRHGTFLILLASMFGSSCGGGGSPSAPTSTGGSPVTSYRGETVSAIDGSPISGVAVKVGGRAALSDNLGRFELTDLQQGAAIVTLSGTSIVERRRNVAIPADLTKETLIPAAFDLEAFDEMFRGNGRLQRWTSAPALVVLGSVMLYHRVGSDEYQATSASLTDEEIALLIEHLTEGLALLTGQRFTSFSSVKVERPASGERVNTLRTGSIVAGRYRNVQAESNTIGLGRWAIDEESFEVTGGAIYLEHNFDRSETARRLLRIHELGHALGYQHVTKRTSIMNPTIGPSPTEFDRSAAMIAFERQPGNQSPDDDVADGPRSPGGIGGRSVRRPVWSPVIH